MTDSEKPDESQQPELVVDTDWKEQVAREKEQAAEAARQQQASGQSETADSSASEQAAAEAAGDDAPAESSSPDQSAGDELALVEAMLRVATLLGAHEEETDDRGDPGSDARSRDRSSDGQ